MCSQEGLYFNISRAKLMKIIAVPVQSEKENISVNGQDVENVKNFIYLGAVITEDYDYCNEIK